jgi:hypothetical protein
MLITWHNIMLIQAKPIIKHFDRNIIPNVTFKEKKTVFIVLKKFKTIN